MGKKSLLGIDISSTCVRVVRSEGLDGNGAVRVSGVSLVPLPEGAVFAGKINSPGVVAAAVKQAVAELKASKVPAVFGISDPDAGANRLRIATSIPENKRIGFFRTKGVRVVDTVMTSEGNLSFYTMGSNVDSDGNSTDTVMTAIAPISEVDKIRQIAEVANIKVHRIDLTAAATVRAAVRDYPSSTSVRAVVDIGATTTRVIIIEGLHVQEIRTIPSGGLDLTESISSALNCPIQEAESMKWGMRLGSDSGSLSYGDDDFGLEIEEDDSRDKAVRALGTASDALVEQIAQALSVSAGVADIEGIFVVGGTGLLKGFLSRLHRRTGKRPLLASPWVSVIRGKHTEQLFLGASEGMTNEKILLSFLTACGLATPVVGEKR